MILSPLFRAGLLWSAGVLLFGQQAPAPVVAVGIPPRAAPTDYQAQGRAGTVTLAADFTGHSVATPDGTFTTDDFVAVEVGLFGGKDERLTLSPDQFSLRINGKKGAVPSVPYLVILRSLKDPEWEESQASAKAEKAKTSIGGGGGGGRNDDPKPLPPKMPVALAHIMGQKVQRASLPEGDRPLPVAGLLFFQHGGKIGNIRSIELLYNGPAGTGQVSLQP